MSLSERSYMDLVKRTTQGDKHAADRLLIAAHKKKDATNVFLAADVLYDRSLIAVEVDVRGLIPERAMEQMNMVHKTMVSWLEDGGPLVLPKGTAALNHYPRPLFATNEPEAVCREDDKKRAAAIEAELAAKANDPTST